MNRLIAILLFISISSASELDQKIPFDWSGQFGIITKNGSLIWNQDWHLGPLLYDGTFNYFPERFGEDYQRDFRLSSLDYIIPHTGFIDSSLVTSSLDYFRGDYEYDQLELNFNFIDPSRKFHIYGFKRNYTGLNAQYLRNDGRTVPLSQSYRFDYQSIIDNGYLAFSVAHNVTDVELNYSFENDFTQDDRNTLVGFIYSKAINRWNFYTNFSLHNQDYFVKIPEDTSRTQYLLGRKFWESNGSFQATDQLSLSMGFISNWQDFNIKALTAKKRDWHTIYFAAGYNNFSAKVGIVTQDGKNIEPLFSISTLVGDRQDLWIHSTIDYEPKTRHILFWDKYSNESMEKWLTGTITGGINRNYNYLKSTVTYSKGFDYDDITKFGNDMIVTHASGDQINGSISGFLTLFRRWGVKGFYSHTINQNSRFSGFQDRALIEIQGVENLFNDKMEAVIRLGADGKLNRSSGFDFDIINGYPYKQLQVNNILHDNWMLNLSVEITVSKMTIIWDIKNILNSMETAVKDLEGGLGPEYFWMQNTAALPRMGKFAQFRIIWNFAD
jgi:hypothetical protein